MKRSELKPLKLKEKKKKLLKINNHFKVLKFVFWFMGLWDVAGIRIGGLEWI